MTKKYFDHILIAATLDRPPQARHVREDYQPTEWPISEEELRRHPLIPLFPSLVVRKDSKVDTKQRDKIANHVEQLARDLTPFTVQWGSRGRDEWVRKKPSPCQGNHSWP